MTPTKESHISGLIMEQDISEDGKRFVECCKCGDKIFSNNGEFRPDEAYEKGWRYCNGPCCSTCNK